MTKEMAIMDMPERGLISAWEACVRAAMSAKVAVEDEVTKATREHVGSLPSSHTPLSNISLQTDHEKRTFDYEPFLRQYFTSLHEEGLLNPLLGRDENGKKLPANRKAKGKGKS